MRTTRQPLVLNLRPAFDDKQIDLAEMAKMLF
jgi:hypothetical protein